MKTITDLHDAVRRLYGERRAEVTLDDVRAEMIALGIVRYEDVTDDDVAAMVERIGRAYAEKETP